MDQLKSMECFIEIARRGSLSRAAKELGLSRPLVSLSLKQLEVHLGVRLVNRTTRQLSLTEAGEDYLGFCRTVLGQIREKEAQLSRFQSSPTGTIKILSSLAFGNYVLAPIAVRFQTLYPNISITMIVTDNFISRRQLADQSFDLAFVMNQVDDSATSISTKVGAVQWVTCAAPSYVVKHEAIEDPEDLTRHNCLAHRSFIPPNVWRFSKGGNLIDVPIRGQLFSNSVMVLRAGALQGAGVSMLPLYCIEDDLEQGRLVHLLADHLGPAKPVYAIYPNSLMPQKSRLFVDFCRSAMKRRKR